MPAYAATILRTNLLSLLESTLNGDTSIARVGGAVFNTTADAGVPPLAGQRDLAFTAPLTAQGSLATGIGNATAILTLQDSHEAAQFRAGDGVRLLHTDGATLTGPLTVVSVNPTSQRVVLSAAPGAIYPPGSVLVRPATTIAGAQPGGVAPAASDGAPLDSMAVASFLQAVEDWAGNNPTNYGRYASNGVITDVSLVSNLVVDEVGGLPDAFTFANAQSLIGATCTFTATTATPALQNQRAKVTAVVIAANLVTMTLDNFQDAPDAAGVRADLTQWGNDVLGVTPAAGDVFDLDLDLSSHDKLAVLGEAGGDMSTLVSAILTMHRKLDPAAATPEISQRSEDAVWQVARGTTLRLVSNPNLAVTAPAFLGGANQLAVEMDGAVGDIPFPLTGTIRLMSQADNVNSAGGSAPAGAVGSGGFVAYTRNRRSNILNCPVTPAGANFLTGSLVELAPGTNGFAVNKGFSPTIENKQISGILWELMEALRQYIVLEGR
jgi:hypothetical protein